MPRVVGGRRGVSRNVSSSSISVSKTSPPIPDYGFQETALRRHRFIDDTPIEGNPNSLVVDQYFLVELTRFRRSFGAGSDDPPTPTDSNNYASDDVFNGSKIENFNTIITLKNINGSRPASLDVFEIAVSFWDVLVWDTVFPTKCPLSFITTATNEGEIQTKTPTTTLVDYNDWLSFKFLQHYMKYKGTLNIGPAGSANNQANIVINGLPPKCRRSQTGMWYGYVFKNSAERNEGITLTLDYSKEVSFDEIPSENRLPYIN